MAFPFAIYFGLAVVIGWLGRHSRTGLLGTFVLSLLFSPFLVGMVVFAFGRPKVTQDAEKPI
jgi:hypothetical protein